jgi:hypothetical protein
MVSNRYGLAIYSSELCALAAVDFQDDPILSTIPCGNFGGLQVAAV